MFTLNIIKLILDIRNIRFRKSKELGHDFTAIVGKAEDGNVVL